MVGIEGVTKRSKISMLIMFYLMAKYPILPVFSFLRIFAILATMGIWKIPFGEVQ